MTNEAEGEKVIRIGHSPDPDDAFMFYGFASGKVTIDGYEIEHVLHGIQDLNEISYGDDPLEVTALSAHSFFKNRDRYECMRFGSSVGRGYGPKLIALEQRSLESLEGCKIALPGSETTAALVARMLLPEFTALHTDFLDVMSAVESGKAEAGVIIHEQQLTYEQDGFIQIADLAELFAAKYDSLPLPLGLNCLRRDLSPHLKALISNAYRESIRLAFLHKDAAIDYCAQFGRDMDKEKLERFVDMYVNDDSVDFAKDVERSWEILESNVTQPTPQIA